MKSLNHLSAAIVILAILQGCAASEFVLDLTPDNFTQTLSSSPSDKPTLMLFYAHWCPACKAFMPLFMKAADTIEALGDVNLFIGRVDCAEYRDLCNTFQVPSYPTLRYGKISDFLADPPTPSTLGGARTTEGVLEELGKLLGRPLAPVSAGENEADTEAEQQQQVETNEAIVAKNNVAKTETENNLRVRPHLQIVKPKVQTMADVADIERATVLSWEYIISTPLLLQGQEARQALFDWVQLISNAHPLKKCRGDALDIVDKFSELWPSGSDSPHDELSTLSMCYPATAKTWKSCKGSRPDTRGFTCGLWQLFHALSVNVDEESPTSGGDWLKVVTGYVKYYFQCSDCSKHFVIEATTPAALAVKSKKEAVLWMWATHNKVNKRLGENEKKEATGDPEYPHIQFPSADQCSTCSAAAGSGDVDNNNNDWNGDAVYEFLSKYYKVGESVVNGGVVGKQQRRNGTSSWLDAVLVCGVVAGGVYMYMRKSSHYGMKKAGFRML